MKLLSAFLSALVVVGFAGAASAQCAGAYKAQQTAETPIIVDQGSVGS